MDRSGDIVREGSSAPESRICPYRTISALDQEAPSAARGLQSLVSPGLRGPVIRGLQMILNLFPNRPDHPLADAKEFKRILAELRVDKPVERRR